MSTSPTLENEMRVTKRNGELETIEFDKILNRIKSTGQEADIHINYTSLVMKVIDQLYDKIPTTKIDELSAEQCASMSSIHPDYNTLAGRIIISNHHKNTSASFSAVMKQLYEYLDKHQKPSPLISQALYDFVCQRGDELDAICDYGRDYLIDYFGYKTLERAYLMKINGRTVERPQHMWLRVAVGLHGDNMERVLETYSYMSQKYFTHATPTLFNAGTPRPQLSSCFLLSMEDDSIEGIYNTLKDCALISKWAGGIGLHIHNVRASGSHIRGTNGSSNGIVPMLRVFNNTAKYVDQCLDPDTIVYTKRGPIPIRQIVIGDEVITDDGQLYEIRKVLDYQYEGPIHELKIKHAVDSMKLTDMHPLWAIQTDETTNINNIVPLLERGLLAPDFIEVKNLKYRDYIGFPIPTYEKDIAHYTKDDCQMYGILMATGRCCSDYMIMDLVINHFYNESIPTAVEIYLKNCNINYKIDYTENGTKFVFERNNMFKFTNEMLYYNHYTKQIMPQFLHLPKDKIKSFLRGFIGACGQIIEDENNKKYAILVTTTSKNLVDGLQYMLLRLGILCWFENNKKCDKCNHDLDQGEYKIYIPSVSIIDELFAYKNTNDGIPPTLSYFEYNGYLFSPVASNTASVKKQRVIDIEVDHEDHHNFLTHNGLVKNGGGKRNGSFAIYLEPWHADIELFLQMRKNHGDEELKARDLFYALWIPDLFMKRVKENGTWTLMCPDECPGLSDVYGDEFDALYTKYEESGKGRTTINARDLWFQILDAQMETGTPYLLYKDAANKKSNQKNLGTIKSSNLCVAPETKILTDKGHIEIQQLEGQKVNVWNGEEFSEVTVFKTGKDQELIDVYTSDGCKLTCTKYHKFFIQNKYSKKSIEIKEAKDLKENDKIMKCDYPCINGKETMLYPYTHGFFCGDGCYRNVNKDPSIKETRCKFQCYDGHFYCKKHIDFETEHLNTENLDKNRCNAMSYLKKPISYLYDDKKKLLEHMEYRSFTENGNRMILSLPLDIAEKYFVPMNHTMEDKMEWLSGYCDADGTIANNQNNQQLQMASINLEFLTNIKMMLQTCGINPKLSKCKEAGTSNLPDGRGGHRDFKTQAVYRITVTSNDLVKLIDLGFHPRRLKLNPLNKPNRCANQFVKISKLEDNNRRDDTFCFTEPKRNAGIFNGILTSQCTEILEYSDHENTAVCNLGSIALPTFINTNMPTPTFDFQKLHEVTKVLTYNLNRVIDINYYPTEKTRRSNMRNRPIGIGIQGLADTFILMDMAFNSDDARKLNRDIFETIYHAALECSMELAIKEGAYETFAGSPASQGILQFDMWDMDPTNDRYDWADMKQKIQQHGLRNSLLLAPMPTASTSQILGFNECIEPITSNIYSRRTIAGEFVITNKYLMKDLIKLGLWNEKVKNSIIANNGSIQQIEGIPQEIKEKYRTVWEIPMRVLIDMAADRGAFICQSQSLNLWQEDPNYNSLTSMHFYSWSRGLKTGIYYLRRRARHQAQQFTIEPEKKQSATEEEEEDEICEMCSS